MKKRRQPSPAGPKLSKSRSDPVGRGREIQREMVPAAEMSIHQEMEHIVERALAGDVVTVTLRELVFFSTATRDAWMLDGGDGMATPLCLGGTVRPASPVEETEHQFVVHWMVDFWFDGEAFMIRDRETGQTDALMGYPVEAISEAVKVAKTQAHQQAPQGEPAKLKPLSRNARCPCGTGRKYKACCFNKGFHYLVDDRGNVFRDVPLHPGLAEMLPKLKAEFIRTHGRPPNPDERLFDNIDLAEVNRQVVEVMRKTGIDPGYIYAYEKTGLLLSEENRHLMPTKDVEEFEAAMEEYAAEHGGGDLDA